MQANPSAFDPGGPPSPTAPSKSSRGRTLCKLCPAETANACSWLLISAPLATQEGEGEKSTIARLKRTNIRLEINGIFKLLNGKQPKANIEILVTVPRQRLVCQEIGTCTEPQPATCQPQTGAWACLHPSSPGMPRAPNNPAAWLSSTRVTLGSSGPRTRQRRMRWQQGALSACIWQ